ncbi:MAG: hypothetical protein WDO17_02745 [Alphaproteobacteria bacterium]
MLRIFGWVVRFFDWLKALDDRFEAAWRTRGWPDRLKWWFGGSLALALFALLLICIPGAVLLEANRLYHSLRGGNVPPAGLVYLGLGTFAVAFAAVTLTIAFVSCPLFMLQLRQRGR